MVGACLVDSAAINVPKDMQEFAFGSFYNCPYLPTLSVSGINQPFEKIFVCNVRIVYDEAESIQCNDYKKKQLWSIKYIKCLPLCWMQPKMHDQK